MGLTSTQITNVEGILKKSIRGKLTNYNPEPAQMPFHTRLLGKDRMALFSFIQSLNTTFGTQIFEAVALVLAQEKFAIVGSQKKSGDKMSESAQAEIQKIMNELTTSTTKPNKSEEIKRIQKVAQKGNMVKVKPTKIDLTVETKKGNRFLIDIKTAKPNKDGFKGLKRTLLEWIAVALAENPDANISSLIAIPYNPYEPKPYQRWTMVGMLDTEYELKVAEEFWNFVGGENSYEDLLNCFERVGIDIREEMDEYFAKF